MEGVPIVKKSEEELKQNDDRKSKLRQTLVKLIH